MNYLKNESLPIITERLLLRLLEPTEAGLMVTYLTENREHLTPWEPVRTDAYYSLELWERELRSRQGQFFSGEAARLVMLLKDKPLGPVIGVTNFTEIMRGVFQACFLGYSLHHQYQGQGFMFEALSAAIDYMYETFHMHRVMANYMPHNVRSGELLKRLGFTVEGYARDYLKIAGQWEDHILTAKIAAQNAQ